MARSKKTPAPKLAVQQETPFIQPAVVAQVVKSAPSLVSKSYKCIECGQENEEKRCKRCGSAMVREI